MAPQTTGIEMAGVLEEYKVALLTDSTLSMNEFCRRKQVSARHMQDWLSRQDLTVAEIRRSVFGEDANDKIPGTTGALYHSLWEEYIAEIKQYGIIPLTDFCKRRNVKAKSFGKWMARQGLTVKDAATSAGVSAKAVRDADKYFLPLTETTSHRMSVLLKDYKKLLLMRGSYSMRDFC